MRPTRIVYETPVEIVVPQKSSIGPTVSILEGMSFDLSANGMAFFSKYELDYEQIVIRFTGPDGDQVIRTGHLAWKTYHPEGVWRYGISFEVPLSGTQILALSELERGLVMKA